MANAQVKPLYLKNDEYIDGNGEPATKSEIRAWEDHLGDVADQRGGEAAAMSAEMEKLRKALADAEKKAADKAAAEKTTK